MDSSSGGWNRGREVWFGVKLYINPIFNIMSDNNKKKLANRIKADLKKELSGDLTEYSDYWLVEGNSNIFVLKKDFIDAGKIFFEPNELEKKDYDEIVRLLHQRLQLRDQALAKERHRREEKLDSNPRLFYHSGCRNDKAGAYEERDMRLIEVWVNRWRVDVKKKVGKNKEEGW